MAKGHWTSDGWRNDKQKNHLLRAPWHDYKEPKIYMLTLVTTNRMPLLGELMGERIILSPLGKEIEKEITRIPSYHGAEAIEIYKYVVMPDHVHILLRVIERLPKHLGRYIRWFKLQCNDRSRALGAVPPSMEETLFAPEYHDRILTKQEQLQHMVQYIEANPRRLAMKRANPELFKIHQETIIGSKTYTTLGNIFLAEHPQREMLQCSRRLTQQEIDTKREECLAEAANGTVYVSAAISEGEKQICRALREAGFPLIVLLEEGFPKPEDEHYAYYKPKGVYYEACAAGKLLLVEPAAEEYEREEIAARVIAKAGDIPHTTKRYRFLALNAMAEDIARRNSGES